MKILFTYGFDTKEGFESIIPMTTSLIPPGTIDEIEGSVIEKVSDLIKFIEECYRLLKVGAVAKFSAPHYASNLAWGNPLAKRGVSELTLNFASKDWREQYKFTDAEVLCNFEVVGNFAVEASCMQRSDDARGFWLQRYNNVAQAIIFTLTKKEL